MSSQEAPQRPRCQQLEHDARHWHSTQRAKRAQHVAAAFGAGAGARPTCTLVSAL